MDSTRDRLSPPFVGCLSIVRTWGQTTLKEISAVKSSKLILELIEEHLEHMLAFLRKN